MIVRTYDDGEYTSFQSQGCGCCSVQYYPSLEYWKQQEEWGVFPFEDKTPEQAAVEHLRIVIENLKDNIEVTKKACEKLGIDFQTLL